MTRLVQNRLIGRLLLAFYALSTVVAGSFHDHHLGHGHSLGHGHDVALSCSHAEHADGELACVEHNDHCNGRHASSVQNSEQSSDDICVVCRFLGLSSLPTAPAPLPANPELVATVRTVEPRQAALPLALTLHSRAPPRAV
jgi:hypothetical protein